MKQFELIILLWTALHFLEKLASDSRKSLLTGLTGMTFEEDLLCLFLTRRGGGKGILDIFLDHFSSSVFLSIVSSIGFGILGMKSSLRRLRGFALYRSEPKEKKENRPPAKLDELVQATQDIQELRSCYDGLLSAAAATANSAYEFSEALHEMGTCLLEKTALNDDEDSGRVSLMLGKAQFELQRLVDNYRAHIIQTITTPSECLLKELQIVEGMKQQCDDKRNLYKFMLTAPRQKGRLRYPKGDAFTPQQLQAAREDYEEEANLFVFRLKSLKQGQSRSLFTQIARHHAAQLNFFRKGFKSLELIEPLVKSTAEQQHIDYHFNELQDDDMDYDIDGGSCHDSSDDGELSFDYGLKELADDVPSMYRNSTVIDRVDNTTTQASSLGLLQENVNGIQAELLYGNQRTSQSSQSAPIFADRNFNFSEKMKNMPPPSTRKFHTYVLPTPVDVTKNSASAATSFSSNQLKTNASSPTQISYSSPLISQKLPKYGEKNSQKSSKGLEDNRFTSFSIPEAKKVRRHAFSGPFFTSSGFSKVEDPTVHSRLSQTSLSIRMAATTSPPRSTLRISELHELPRPPSSLARAVLPNNLVGHSAPLVSRGQEIRMTGKVFPLVSETASPLPAPPAVLRSFSIPYSGRRTAFGTLDKLLEAPCDIDMDDEVDSPPLSPLSLKVFHDESTFT